MNNPMLPNMSSGVHNMSMTSHQIAMQNPYQNGNMGGAMNPAAGMNVYRPSGKGTLIADLIKDNDSTKGQSQRQPTQPPAQPYNHRGYQYDTASHDSVSRDGRSRDSGSKDHERMQKSHYSDYDSRSSYDGIEKLADDVNHSLQVLEDSETKKRKRRRRDTETELSEDSDRDPEKSSKNEPIDKITLKTLEQENDYAKMFTEFLILLTIYVIMSQPFVISLASCYINQLNPSEEGTISLTGIIIYGIILTIMFFVVRKIVFYKLQ